MERKEGESIQQGSERIKAMRQSKVQPLDEGELDAAIVVADANPETIKQGVKTINAKPNNRRIGQESVFGERKYDSNPSLASRAFNGITDGLHLTNPPTYQDGYGRTLNADVPTGESAQGQELKRMGQTAMKDVAIATIPFFGKSLFYNPLGTVSGFGVGVGVDQGLKFGLNSADTLLQQNRGLALPESGKNALRFTTGLFTGKRAYDWGTNTTKRGIEVAMHTTGDPNPIPQILKGIKNRNGKQLFNVGKYILTGKNESGLYNTLGGGIDPLDGIFRPTFYTGLHGASNESGGTYNPDRDLVRSYLYKTPFPEEFTRVTPTDHGLHTNYVLKNYPGRDIDVYEIPNYMDHGDPTHPIDIKDYIPIHGALRLAKGPSPGSYDAGGHYMELGLSGIDEVARYQDIWKFNPKDYKRSGFRDPFASTKKIPGYTMYALGLVDYHGNPFIVRTKGGLTHPPVSK